MPKARILCIDDEDSPREALRFILKDRYEFVGQTNGARGLAALESEGPFDVVLLDMKMPDMTGLEVLAEILKRQPHQPVVMVTAISDARTVVQAMKLGAADYLNKPFDADEIRLVVQRLIREGALRREPQPPSAPGKFEPIIGASGAMQRVYALVERLLNAETTVLITGETGTGKELIARALHFQSVRKAGPFIPVHCAAIPGELLESELFGHEKGAFTGALARRIGMFEAATGGTLFLDEIGEMPIGTQTKLLRAIQEREIRRVGSQETIQINVRLVCATNRNLAAEVKKGTFREDLFYRINVVPVLLPSLRERREDIPTLALHFTERYAQEFARPVPQFTPAAMDRLVRYSWPGNVRELEHTIERLLITCDANPIDAEHLPFIITQPPAEPELVPPPLPVTAPPVPLETLDLPKLTDDLERHAIEQALLRTGGVLTEAAKLLNITRRILRYKMDKLGIPTGKDDGDSSSLND